MPETLKIWNRGQPLVRILTDWTTKLVKVRWIVGLLLVVLGMVGPGGVRGPFPPDGILVLGLVVLGYNLLFSFALAVGGPDRPALFLTHRRFAFWQVTADWLTLVGLVFLTGGAFNPVALFFVFHVVVVAIYLPPRDAGLSGALAFLVLLAGTVLELAGGPLVRSGLWGGVAPRPGTLQTLVFLGSLAGCYGLSVYVVRRLGDRLCRDEQELMDASDALRTWRERARALNQISIAINLESELESIFERTVQAATSVCNAPAAGLRMYDESSGTLELVASVGLGASYLRKGTVHVEDSPVDQRVLTGEIVAVSDLVQDPMFEYPEAAEEEGIVSVLCAPLEAGGHVIGVLRVYDRRPRVFGPTAREFLAGLASLAAAAVRKARAYRELEERDRTTREFVVSATHSLRSPLAATQNMMDVLLEGYTGDLNDQQRDVLLRARRKNEHLLDVVRELLFLTTRDIETARGTSREMDFRAEAEGEVGKLRDQAEEEGLDLQVEFEDGDYTIEGTPEEVRHIVGDLVQNAIKYTPRGGNIRMRAADKPYWVHFSVADSGIGIPEGVQEKIFQAFYRAPNARDRTEVGTGLGLTLVKRIVVRMGGRITVKSEPGEGTTFDVWLPRRASLGQRNPTT